MFPLWRNEHDCSVSHNFLKRAGSYTSICNWWYVQNPCHLYLSQQPNLEGNELSLRSNKHTDSQTYSQTFKMIYTYVCMYLCLCMFEDWWAPFPLLRFFLFICLTWNSHVAGHVGLWAVIVGHSSWSAWDSFIDKTNFLIHTTIIIKKFLILMVIYW